MRGNSGASRNQNANHAAIQSVEALNLSAEIGRTMTINRSFKPVIRVQKASEHRVPTAQDQGRSVNNLSQRRQVEKLMEQNEHIMQQNYLKSIISRFDTNMQDYEQQSERMDLAN